MEEDIVEIYVSEDHEFYMYIPASAQTFRLDLGAELDQLPDA